VGSWVVLGDVERLRGEVTAAVSAYRKALAIDPQHGHALLAAGLLLAQHGDAAEAVALLRRRVKIAAGDAGPWNALAIAHLRAGEYDPAIDAATRARDLQPADLSLHANLATALLASGRADDALVASLAARALATEAAPTAVPTSGPSAGADPKLLRLEALAIKAALVGALVAPACGSAAATAPKGPAIARDVRAEVRRRLQGSGLLPSDDELDELAPRVLETTRRARLRCASTRKGAPAPAPNGDTP
jgi:tetratricopeptide (TPR) repeat protein